ncbi:MAG: DUF835 domain-containing protein [Thermoplasmata archaeon]|nr:DUF835 domain-containing protein [Thermoplasmata archaeon]
MREIPAHTLHGTEKGLNMEIKSPHAVQAHAKEAPEGMGAETGDVASSRVEIREGEVYLLETKNLDKAHDFIMKYIAENDKNNAKYLVNIFTRHMPVVNGIYREAKGICGNVFEISTVSGKNRISPASLGYIKHTVTSTAFAEKKPFFVIDCIDVLAMYADKEKVGAMLEELRDTITATGGLGFVIIDPDTYDEKELAQLRRFKTAIRI